VLTCYRTRRRLGAWLDGALDTRPAVATARHVAGCSRCREEADGLERLRALLRGHGAAAAPADWTGFWEGVARGIHAQRHPPRAVSRPRRLTPRLAVGSLAATALVASLTLWQVLGARVTPADAIVINSADTEHPGGTVMVYSPPEKDLAVVWVFGLE
jgi:anti-sigma factor RsiW